MRILILLLAALSVLPVVGQEMTLWLVDDNNPSLEYPVTGPIDFGQTVIWNTSQKRLRIRNNTAGSLTIQIIYVSTTQNCDQTETGFCLEGNGAGPALPRTIPVGGYLEIPVYFKPTSAGDYSTALMVNTTNLGTLHGTGIGSARLLSSNGSELLSGATIDFGKPLLGNFTEQTFTLENNSAVAVTIPSASIKSPQRRVACSGASQQPMDIPEQPFSSPDLPLGPIQLGSGESRTFSIRYQPLAPGFDMPSCFETTLMLGTRSFTLFGGGAVLPNAPQSTLVFNTTNFTSQQQPKITVQLAGVAQGIFHPTLKMEFQPTIPGVLDDPAIYFLATQGRNLSLLIEEGSDKAMFQGQSELTFQTGTTAGTILFTLELDGKTIQQSITISPSAIQLSSARAVRQSPSLQVFLTGFDNTYTASQLSFTFYDSAGNTIKPGLMNVDATQDFRNYFTQTQVGGMFSLLANFPVTGNASEVASVDVSIRNANGTTRTNRLQF